MLAYGERGYECRACRHAGPGWKVVQQSPPEFLLQPHRLYPMTQEAFDYWVAILKAHFPDHPVLSGLGTTFAPRLPEQVEAMREARARAHPVVEMKDQDGARRAQPDLPTAIEWLEIMEPGDTLTFRRTDGGTLHLNLNESAYGARCLDGSGTVLSEAVGLDEGTVRDAIARYLDGNTAGAVRRLRPAVAGVLGRLWNHVIDPS
jgi:hypothetical protein